MTKILGQLNVVDSTLSLAEYCFGNGASDAAVFIMKIMASGNLELTPQTTVGEFVAMLGDGSEFHQYLPAIAGPIVRAPISTIEKIKMSMVLLIGFLVIFGGGGIVLLMYIRGDVDNELVRDWFGLLMELIKIFSSNSITDVV